MERLCGIKDKLIESVECQMCHLDKVNAKELGEVIDMIKDISEAVYYCTITEAMEGGAVDGDSSTRHISAHLGAGSASGKHEGKSFMTRKTYMEHKEAHKDKAVMMQELEKYAQELTADLIEMIEDASPEEKQYLSNRIATLATKIK